MLPRRSQKKKIRRALQDVHLQTALDRASTLHNSKYLETSKEVPWEEYKKRAREIREKNVGRLPELIERFTREAEKVGAAVHRAATPAAARETVLPHRPGKGGPADRQIQVDGDRGDRPQRFPRKSRPGGRRDRPGRVDHPARRRSAVAHHGTGHPPDQGEGRRDHQPEARPACSAGHPGDRPDRPGIPARVFHPRRHRDFRGQLRRRRVRDAGHRQQRGERPPGDRPCRLSISPS